MTRAVAKHHKNLVVLRIDPTRTLSHDPTDRTTPQPNSPVAEEGLIDASSSGMSVSAVRPARVSCARAARLQVI